LCNLWTLPTKSIIDISIQESNKSSSKLHPENFLWVFKNRIEKDQEKWIIKIGNSI
jgi:hypothetical protein